METALEVMVEHTDESKPVADDGDRPDQRPGDRPLSGRMWCR